MFTMTKLGIVQTQLREICRITPTSPLSYKYLSREDTLYIQDYRTSNVENPTSPATSNTMPQPHERVAIITGAASGIGLALTKHLLGKNYKVFMADLNPNGPSIASSLTGSPSPTFIHTDVSSWDAQAALFKTASSHSGSIDFFAANAGIDDKENVFQDFGDDEPKCPNLKTLDVDLLSVFYGLKLFVHYARKSRRQGLEGVRKMVITASMMGIYPFETNPQYCAAKHGVCLTFYMYTFFNVVRWDSAD